MLNNPEDNTKLSLLFANQTEDDILCRETLEQLQEEHKGRFKVWYTVDRPTDSWKYSSGLCLFLFISVYFVIICVSQVIV